MQIDFVKTPYTTGPSMIKNTGPVFISQPNQEIIAQKKAELDRFGTDLWEQDPKLNKVIEKAAGKCNIYSDSVLDLSLRLEEDVAVMHQGQLAAICFCFPSGFIPRERIGMTLSDIHRPVADGEMLVRASPGIARVMTEQESFRRWVWTVTVNPNLSNHPSTKVDTVAESMDDLYFRYETQTTLKVDDRTSLFFVHVNVVPLGTVWNHRILDSINSMSDSILTYKNLHHIKHLLNTLGE